MSLSKLPLSYCTNVHPGLSVVEVEHGLDRFTVPVHRNLGAPLAAGLWLARPVVHELLESPDRLQRFAEALTRRGLSCHTLNAFPYGDFHSARVKENVYLPDWSHSERLEYSFDCARVLAALLPAGVEGSISTLPLGFKGFEQPAGMEEQCREQLIELARRLDRLREESDVLIRMAVEPEPFCLLERTDEAISFFARLEQRADDLGASEVVRRHVGLCYDVCHQAVEFEDVAESIRSLDAAGVRINKVHITCAIELENAAENRVGREALARYVEPRYLHQTMARSASGEVVRTVDLTARLALNPPPEFRDADTWRVHFHVPVDREQLGPLKTTRNELKQALSAVARLDYAPHLEVETYTWEVLPDGQSSNLVDGLTRELVSTAELLGEL